MYLKASSITWRGVLGTRAVLIAVGAVTALQFLFTYAPFMESFFNTRPVSLAQGVQIVGALSSSLSGGAPGIGAFGRGPTFGVSLT